MISLPETLQSNGNRFFLCSFPNSFELFFCSQFNFKLPHSHRPVQFFAAFYVIARYDVWRTSNGYQGGGTEMSESDIRESVVTHNGEMGAVIVEVLRFLLHHYKVNI